MRVRWTDEERAILVERGAQLLHSKDAFSVRDCLLKAQDALPKDRRRQIAALTQVPWFYPEVHTKLKEIERQQTQAVEQEIQQAVQSVEQKARAELEDSIALYVGRILGKALTVAVRDPELRAIFGHDRASIGHDVAINHEPHKHHLVSHRKERMHRVVVAGVLNSQARAIETEFKNKLDLRFWSKDQSNDTLKSMLSHADAAIGMVGFLAHSHDGILKASKVPYTQVSGGVTQVKQALERLLETV